MVETANRTLGGELHQVVVASHRWRVDAEPGQIRPRIGPQLDRTVRVSIDVAPEARDAMAWLLRDSMGGVVEPGGWRGVEELLETFHLLRSQQPIEDLEVVTNGDLPPVRLT